MLTRSFLYTSGTFQEEEDEIIVQHLESQNGKESDLNYLKAKLNRPRNSILERIADFDAPKAKKGQRFTVDEYMVVLKHVLGPKIPNEAKEIIKLCDRNKSWKPLELKLQRDRSSIKHSWSEIIHPTIFAHLT